MNKRLFLFAFILCTTFILFAENSEFAVPVVKKGAQIIKHQAYTLQYNEQYEQADWVAYKLTKKEVSIKRKRKGTFRPDPLVKTKSAETADYVKSGYDRGHLAPAADMAWSEMAMSESFFMSNMSPQLHEFNAGIWEDLERTVRYWAKADNELYIVTGPVWMTKKFPSIGKKNKVAVPPYFFKVILDNRDPVKKAIGFLIPNQATTNPLPKYAVSIDYVESVTGLDFFPQLPDNLEKTLEAKANFQLWSFQQEKAQKTKRAGKSPKAKERF